jgi:hypothetical protein
MLVRAANSLIWVAAIAVLGSGCSALSTQRDGRVDSNPALAANPEGVVPAVAPAMFSLEVRTAGKKKPEIQQLPLPGTMHVQEVLEQNGLVKRFRRMNIQVVRATGGDRAKLDIKYDHSTRSVDPLYDYAIHPSDHLIVTEDTTTALDDMLNSLAEPLGPALGRGRR